MSDDATINIEVGKDDEAYVRTGFELLVSDGKSSTRFPICAGEVAVGGAGSTRADLTLDCEGLADRQAVFHYRGGSLFFTNLNSSLPIAVNGVPSTFSPLKDSDQVSIGHYELQVFHVGAKLATLEGCTDPYRGQMWGVDASPVTIGRGTGKRINLIDLDDRTISRAHATIVHQAGEFWLQPDTTGSPVRINGKAISQAEKLPNGGLIQLGQQLLRFRINEIEKSRRDLIPQEATILFCDVWNYSTFAEGRPLEDTITQMNEFYSGLGKAITARGGVLLTFLGDAMMAVFGSEGPDPRAAEQAVRAALDMQTRLGELNDKWAAEGKPTLQAGVGINTGEVMVGDVGFTGKYEFAAMGDNTNLAARVEKLTRELDVRIVITASTRDAIGPEIAVKELTTTRVKGRETPVQLFGVVGLVKD